MLSQLRVSAKRAEQIIDEITIGAEPQGRFYALLIAASMIACLGLIANSTAVIIGAMLVSPLMTPIFGIALGMLRGDSKLYWGAITAEVMGIFVAVLSAYLFGLTLSFNTEATPEMLSRTQPNLFDLLVAVFAGFAGAYALLDERVSPALPGVAIATAIVPPLSTVGLCLAMGAYAGAAGAMLLFLANLVSILLVALITFVLGGLAPNLGGSGFTRVLKSFGPTLVGFIIIAVVLTSSLLGIVRERGIRNQIKEVLTTELDKRHELELASFKQVVRGNNAQVLATVRSSHPVSPNLVKSIQTRLSDRLGIPTNLIVRTELVVDVAPTGSRYQVVPPNLNGDFLTEDSSEKVAKIRLATQVLLEQFEGEPGFDLVNVDYGFSKERGAVLLANVTLLRALLPEELSQVESALKARLSTPQLIFGMQYSVRAVAVDGRRLDLHWENFTEASPEERSRIIAWSALIKEKVKAFPNVYPLSVHFNKKQDTVNVLVDVVGPHSLTPPEIHSLQVALNDELKEPITLQIHYRSDFVVTNNGYVSYDEFVQPEGKRQRKGLRKLFQQVSAR